MIYVLTGDDAARIQQRITHLSSGLDGAFGMINRLECSDLNDAIATARSFPFGGGDRVTIFRSPAKWNPPEDFPVVELPEASVLILVIPKLDKRKKFAKSLKKLGRIEDYSILAPWDIKGQVKLVEDQADLLEIPLERGAAEAIALNIGSDTYRISQALNQLSTYCNGSITQQGVEAVLTTSTQTGLDLAESLMAGDKTKTYQLLGKLLELGNHPLQLLSSMVSRCNKVFIAKTCTDQTLIQEAANIGNPGQIYHLRKTDVTTDRLQQILAALLNAELRIKSGGDPVIELERVIAA